jgi:hypothetical protein
MKITNKYSAAGLLCLLCGFGCLAPDLEAAEDDFGGIVHHIETEYHVHRNYRFFMAFAGIAVKLSHFAGVKSCKMAIFENQHLLGAASDAQLDGIVQSTGKSGWQPLIKNFSRRSGERNYIYAQSSGKDLKLLMISVEPDEAVVAQLKIDANKLSQFIKDHSEGQRDRRRADAAAELP